jgi:hypothetical protein
VGSPYIAEGKAGDREPKNFIVERLTLLEEIDKKEPGLVRIRLRADLLPGKMDFKSVAVALKDCPGRSPVLLELTDERESCVLSLQGFGVSGADSVQARLSEVVPAEAFEVA